MSGFLLLDFRRSDFLDASRGEKPLFLFSIGVSLNPGGESFRMLAGSS